MFVIKMFQPTLRSCVLRQSLQSFSRHLRLGQFKTSKEELLEEKRKVLMAKGLPKQKPISGVKDIIIVASGKGGVGKSTIAVNLAIALKQHDITKEVGLLDADIFGPCAPVMLNIKEKPRIKDVKMVPIRNWGIKCMSMGFLINKDEAVVWRGAMVIKALESLLHQVDWGELDYLIVDTPPGTGDVHISLLQHIPITAVVMVTTPQKASLEVTARSIAMFRKMKVNIAGIVSNFSSMKCAQCGHDNLKFRHRVEEYGTEHNLPVIATFPVLGLLTDSCEDGRPIVVNHPDNKISKEFTSLAGLVKKYVFEINSRKKDEEEQSKYAIRN